MLEKLSGVPEGVVAVRAVGKVTREDYEKVLEPLIDQARRGVGESASSTRSGPSSRGSPPGPPGRMQSSAFVPCAASPHARS